MQPPQSCHWFRLSAPCSLPSYQGLSRTAESCTADTVVEASRVACDGLSTAARFHTAAENRRCLLQCHKGSIASSVTINVPHMSNLFVFGTGECTSPTAILMRLDSTLPSEATGCASLLLGFSTRSSMLKTLRETIVALVSASKSVCMEESKMTTDVCRALAHTFQTVCLGYHAAQVRLEAFRLFKPKNICHVSNSLNYYQNDWHDVSKLETLHRRWR